MNHLLGTKSEFPCSCIYVGLIQCLPVVSLCDYIVHMHGLWIMWFCCGDPGLVSFCRAFKK